MLNEEKYELLKESLVLSQRLFSKLNLVASQAKEIDYDESGLYQDDEEMYKRHWLKLSSKIVDNISQSLPEYKIELLNNSSLEATQLVFNLVEEEIKSKISVDYSEDSSISINQIS